ncbi:MAG: hypothetical protein ACI9CE_004011 [Flavobacterium sp.]
MDRVYLEVAYPTNVFQTIIELSKNSDLAKGNSEEEFSQTISSLRQDELVHPWQDCQITPAVQ